MMTRWVVGVTEDVVDGAACVERVVSGCDGLSRVVVEPGGVGAEGEVSGVCRLVAVAVAVDVTEVGVPVVGGV